MAHTSTTHTQSHDQMCVLDFMRIRFKTPIPRKITFRVRGYHDQQNHAIMTSHRPIDRCHHPRDVSRTSRDFPVASLTTGWGSLFIVSRVSGALGIFFPTNYLLMCSLEEGRFESFSVVVWRKGLYVPLQPRPWDQRMTLGKALEEEKRSRTATTKNNNSSSNNKNNKNLTVLLHIISISKQRGGDVQYT